MASYDIEMTTDDTLELDTIIKNDSNATDPISKVETSVSYNKNNLTGIQTKTAIFDPPESGEYDIHINGQVLSINVTDASEIPDSGATHQWNWTSGTGTVIDDVNGSKDATFNSLTWNTGSGTENTHGTLNGTDEYANLGNDIVTTFLDGSGTLFQWHRIPSGNSSRNAIFASFNSSSGNNVSFMVWNDATNEYRSSLTIDGSFAQPTAGDPNSQRGDWVAYAMVYDGSAVTTYNAVPPDYTVSQIDSVSLSATSTASTWDNDVSYGRDTGGTDKYYNGDLDIGFADTTAFSSSELQGFVDDTKQFYE